jgi:hypothetical protein
MGGVISQKGIFNQLDNAGVAMNAFGRNRAPGEKINFHRHRFFTRCAKMTMAAPARLVAAPKNEFPHYTN